MEHFGTILSVVAIGVALMVGGIAQTEWKHKALVHSLIGFGLVIVVLGLTFPWLSDWAPRIAKLVGDVATNPATWFCTLVLLLSAHLLLRWRRIAPDESAASIQRLQVSLEKTLTNQTQANLTLNGMIGIVEDKVDKLSSSVRDQIDKLSSHVDDFETATGKALLRIEPLEKEARSLVARTETLAVLLRDLKDQTAREYELCAQGQLRIGRSLRARDAEAMIKDADTVVMDVGNRLAAAKPSDYSDDQAWLSDYSKWTIAVEKIDTVVGSWQQDHRRILDIRRADYEQSPHSPPQNIKSDSTRTSYKSLCLARDRYLEERSKIFNYFAMKAGDIP
jgi:hypothetical protein